MSRRQVAAGVREAVGVPSGHGVKGACLCRRIYLTVEARPCLPLHCGLEPKKTRHVGLGRSLYQKRKKRGGSLLEKKKKDSRQGKRKEKDRGGGKKCLNIFKFP